MSATNGRGGGWGAIPPAPGTRQLDSEVMNEMLHRQSANTSQRTAAAAAAAPAAASNTTNQGQRWPNTFPRAPQATQQSATPPCSAAFDAFIVLDFEATCEENIRLPQPEVIEFPMVIVDPRQCRVVAEFQRYVRPVLRPTLSNFCVELTGIQQDVVDRATTFPEVYAEAMAFLRERGFGDESPYRSYCMVTCGDWDLGTMLPAQFRASGALGKPASWNRWCNLKHFMKRMQPRNGKPLRVNGMPDMLDAVGLTLRGRHHSGIDDCRNIAAVLCALLGRGYDVRPTNVADGSYTVWHAPDSASHIPMSQLTSLIEGGCNNNDEQPAVNTSRPRLETTAERKREEGNNPRKNPAAAAGKKNTATPNRLPPLIVDATRDPMEELLGSNPEAAANRSPGQLKTISKAMSYILRHGADAQRIPMTENAYVLLDNILRERKIQKEKVTPADVAALVRGNDKQRYRLVYGQEDGRLYIAATQGHSLEGVLPDLRRITAAAEVPTAIHGTFWEAWKAISDCGYLSTMNRHHIHFAKGLAGDDAVISGMRAAAQVLLYLDVEKALEDAVELWESGNGVILTPGVDSTRQLPLKYIKKAVDKKTGAALPFSK